MEKKENENPEKDKLFLEMELLKVFALLLLSNRSI